MDFFIDLIRTIASLLIVLALIYICTKIYIKKDNLIQKDKYIKIVEYIKLNKNSYVLILKVGEVGKVILVNRDNSSTIASLSKEEMEKVLESNKEKRLANVAKNK